MLICAFPVNHVFPCCNGMCEWPWGGGGGRMGTLQPKQMVFLLSPRSSPNIFYTYTFLVIIKIIVYRSEQCLDRIVSEL